ncbi:hypothetical protein C0J52_15060 [Blattella germanica]|nr:hypothetical protein C0J52_15060 [Blattella germanica]
MNFKYWQSSGAYLKKTYKSQLKTTSYYGPQAISPKNFSFIKENSRLVTDALPLEGFTSQMIQMVEL